MADGERKKPGEWRSNLPEEEGRLHEPAHVRPRVIVIETVCGEGEEVSICHVVRCDASRRFGRATTKSRKAENTNAFGEELICPYKNHVHA